MQGVHEQHAGDEVPGPGAQVGGELVDAPLDLFEQVGDVLVVEGQAAAQQREQDDPAGPDVHFGARVQTPADDLCEHKPWFRVWGLGVGGWGDLEDREAAGAGDDGRAWIRARAR